MATKEVIYDDYGRVIAPGELCVYNLGGHIAVGRIRLVGDLPPKAEWQKPAIVQIEMIDGEWYRRNAPWTKPHISKVKHTNLMIIILTDIEKYVFGR
jgi:hypothetical protein